MLQVYTGNGKGKTTAAVGLAVRCLGAGKKVYFAQFMKTLAYSEQEILRRFEPDLILTTSGKPYFIAKEGMLSDEELKAWGDMVRVFRPGSPPEDYARLVNDSLSDALAAVKSRRYDLVVLDEINAAMFYELVTKETLSRFLDEAQKTSPETEIVCTGRCAPKWLCERADLVTQMQEIKHYYKKGVQGRKGIED